MSIEPLENRLLLSFDIHWENRGVLPPTTIFETPDNFDFVFGTEAEEARRVVDAAMQAWETVISDLNDGNNESNVVNVTVSMDLSSDGCGGGTAVNTVANGDPLNGIPDDGSITLNKCNKGDGWFVDKTPWESSEFMGSLINAFVATAQPDNDPITGDPTNPAFDKRDLFSTVAHELGHVLGITRDPDVTWPENVTESAVGDASYPGKGTLWMYNGGVKALFTDNNKGNKGEDTDVPLHIARPDPANHLNGGFYGARDLFNATSPNGMRRLPSLLLTQVMADVYGYSVLPHKELPNFHAQLVRPDPNMPGTLVIRGGGLGDGPVYGIDTRDSSDSVTISAGYGMLNVTIDIGQDVPGTGVSSAFTSFFPEEDVDAIEIYGYDGFHSGTTQNPDGWDKIVLDFSSGNWMPIGGIVVDGGNGAGDIDSLVIHGPPGDGNEYVISGGKVSFSSGFGSIHFERIEELTVAANVASSNNTMTVTKLDNNLGVPTIHIEGSSGTDSITVLETPAGLSNLSISAGDGQDSIIVERSPVGLTVDIDAGDGNDGIQISPTAQELETVDSASVQGGGGTDLLLLDDSNSADASGNEYTFSVELSGLGRFDSKDGQANAQQMIDQQRYFFDAVEQVILNASPGSDEIAILATPSGADVWVSASDGDDTIVVDSNGPGLYGTVDNIKSHLVIDGGGGLVGDDTLTLNDIGDDDNNTVTVSATEVLGDGTFFGPGGSLQYFGLSEMTINMGRGADVINVEGTAKSTDTTINAGMSGDKITVASPPDPDDAPGTGKPREQGTANHIESILTINGEVGDDLLTIVDVDDPTDDVVTLTNRTVGMGPNDTFLGTGGGIEYTSIATLRLLEGTGNDQSAVKSTYKDTMTFIETGKGDDKVTIEDSAGTVNDIRNLLDIDGQEGVDTVAVQDFAETTATTVTISDTQVGAGVADNLFDGGALTYANLEELLVNTGSNDDTVYIESTAPGTATNVNTGDGAELITVESNLTVDLVRSQLMINGGGGPVNALSLIDTADATSDHVTITEKEVGMEVGDSFFGSGGGLTYVNMTQVNVATGSGNDHVNLRSTSPSTKMLLGTSAGDDVIWIDSNGQATGGDVELIRSQVKLIGGPDNNTLFVDDSDDPTGDTVSVTPTGSVAGLVGLGPSDDFFGSGGGIEYDQIGFVALQTSATAADVMNVAPAQAGGTMIAIDGNDPVQSPGDTLNLDLAGAGSPSISVLGMNCGMLTSSTHGDVFYRAIETIHEVSGNDFDLEVDMNVLDGNDGVGDHVLAEFRRQDEARMLSLLLNDAVAFTGDESAVNSLTVIGSSDDDRFEIAETEEGLPILRGDAPLGHTNQTFVGSGRTPTNVSIHYDGGPGAAHDSYELTLAGPHDVGVFQDLVAPAKSGVVNVDGAFTLSYERLTPIEIQGAGGTLIVDATLLDDTTEMLQTNFGDGVYGLTGDGGFETTTLSGFDDLVVLPPAEVSLRTKVATGPSSLGVGRESQYFYLDATRNGRWDRVAGGDVFSDFGLGQLRNVATVVVGDWDGDGTDELGLYNNGCFYLDTTGNGRWDRVRGGDTFRDFGLNAIRDVATPIVGDWDGNGTDDLGLYNDGYVYLDTTGNGRWDRVRGGDTFHDFGIGAIRSVATPIVGDWDGDGTDDLGLYNEGYFYLDGNGDGRWDRVRGGDTFHDFGLRSIHHAATPVVGDWDGDGTDDLGLHNERNFYLDATGNGRWDRVAGGDMFHDYGLSGTPIIGHWASVSPLLAAGGPAVALVGAEQLTLDALTPIVDHAIAVWAESGLNLAEPERLAGVQVHIADLPGARLGEASGTTITLDVDAAGYGWFVDATPEANEEFNRRVSQGLLADASGPAADRMDLLTVVMHELGHVLGHSDHDDDDLLSNDVMNGWLPVGVRRTSEDVDLLFSSTEELDAVLVTSPPAVC